MAEEYLSDHSVHFFQSRLFPFPASSALGDQEPTSPPLREAQAKVGYPSPL